MKFEIKHRFSGQVLFALETDSLKLCLEAAIKANSNLSYSDLRCSNLRCSNLSGSNLSYSDLSYSDLSGSDLSGSNLSGSDLSYSNLRCSNLRNSNLSSSNLRSSNLSGSDLRGSNIILLGQPDNWQAWAVNTDSGLRVCVGCRDFSIEEGRTYWANKPDRSEILQALDYAEAVAKLRGWI